MPPLSNRAIIAFAAIQLVLWGVNYYAFSIFITPMERDLGWTREELNDALSAGLLVSALAGPLVGSWIDHGYGRRVMCGGSLLAAAMYVLWAWSPSPFVFLLLWLGLGFAHSMILYEAAFALLQLRQQDGAAAAITRVTLVAGFAGTVFFPLTQFLLDHAGWRMTALLFAALNVGMAFSLALLLRGMDPVMARERQTERSNGALREAMRQPQFWLLSLLFALLGVIFSVTVFHLSPLLQERDLRAGEVAMVMALIGPAQVAGRLTTLAFGNQGLAQRTGMFAAFAFFVGFALLNMNVPGVLAAGLFCVLFGVGSGLSTILRGTAVAEFLSRRGFGVVNGWVGMPATLARAAGPALAARLWSLGHGYSAVALSLWIAAGLVALTFGALLFTRSRPAPAG
ncbi:MAG: MFS transporter [Hyphomonadaceae bacterium]